MLTKGGQTAAAGTYWNLSNGERVDVKQEGALPGTKDTMYLKAPAIVMLAMGPVIGLVFAIFLPFIGIAMTIGLVARKVGEKTAEAAAGSLSFGWSPVEAYLAGKKRRKEARAKKADEKS